jgi:hypothetical protein
MAPRTGALAKTIDQTLLDEPTIDAPVGRAARA